MTTRSRSLLLAAIALLGLAPLAQAQTTRQRLNNAIALYKDFQVEAARPILMEIVSPGYLQQITAAERVEAYKYLGASYALQGSDSAVTFFVAALDFDPFTDLNPADFSATEIGPFNVARTQIFKVGLRAIEPRVVDPGDNTTAYNFRIITTQRAALTVELIRQSDNQSAAILHQGESNGLRTIPWLGLLPNGEYADSTNYILRATARPVGGAVGTETSTSQFLRIEHSYEPLEDTMPDFRVGAELLQEAYPPRAPWNDLVKGTAMALVALGLPALALTDDLAARQTHMMAAAGIGLGAGAISFSYRRQNRSIPEAVRENERRRQLRNAYNAGVRQRNADRLRNRKIIITPTAGVGG